MKQTTNGMKGQGLGYKHLFTKHRWNNTKKYL